MNLKKTLTYVLTTAIILASSATIAWPGQDDNELLLGLIPEENIFTQMKRHRPLGQYLSGKLGLKIRFTVLSRYPHIVTRFVKRKLDGAFFGIYTSVLGEESLDIEPIARSVNKDGSSTARGYLFVRAGSGIKSVKDLKGKRAAFVDQVTATGYMFAISYLKDNGVRNINSFFSEITFTGAHDSTVYTVISGQADFGAAKGRIVDALAKKDPLIKNELKILARSAELPDNTLYLKKKLPIQVKLRIQQALLDMDKDPEGKKVLAHYGSLRFVEAKRSDLVPVRNMAKKAGLKMKDLKYDY